MDLRLIVLGLFVGIAFDITDAYFSNKYKQLTYRGKNLETHHSIYGLILIPLGFIFNLVFLISFGAGIILSHSIRSKSLLFVKMSIGPLGTQTV